MKKFYAILLGLALVLGMATIASAYDLKVTGEFEATGYFLDGDWYGLDYDAANLYVDIKGEMGDNATGEIKMGFNEYYDDEDFFISLAKLTYNVTDGFYLGVQAGERPSDSEWLRFYNSSVTSGEGFKHSVGNIFFDHYVNVFAGFKFDGGEVTAFSDLCDSDMSFFVQGAYATDALSLKAWLASEDDYTYFIGKVRYAITDALNLGLGLASDDGDVYAALYADYVLEDMVSLKGYLEYSVNPFYNNDYYLLATFTMLGEVFQPFLEWDESDGISVGWDFYMGDSDFWGEYLFDDSEFDFGVDIVF